MLDFFKKFALDFIYITLCAIITLFADSLLKILISLVMQPNINLKTIVIATSLFSSVLFSLLLVFIKHYLRNKKEKQQYNYKYNGIIRDFIVLLKNGEYITIILLFGIGIIYCCVDFEYFIIYSPIFWLNNISNSKIFASVISVLTVLIVYFIYLLVYRYSLYKDDK